MTRPDLTNQSAFARFTPRDFEELRRSTSNPTNSSHNQNRGRGHIRAVSSRSSSLYITPQGSPIKVERTSSPASFDSFLSNQSPSTPANAKQRHNSTTAFVGSTGGALGLTAGHVLRHRASSLDTVPRELQISTTSMFGASNNSGSAAQAQAGPDLDEIQTEVSNQGYCVLRRTNKTTGSWLPLNSRRNKTSAPPFTMAAEQFTEAYLDLVWRCLSICTYRCCRTRNTGHS